MINAYNDVLSTFFWMLTLWCYIVYVENSRLDKYLLTIFFFILGLMAKPMLVTLAFVLLLLDYWPLKRFQLRLSDNKKNPTRHRLLYCGLMQSIWGKFILTETILKKRIK